MIEAAWVLSTGTERIPLGVTTREDAIERAWRVRCVLQQPVTLRAERDDCATLISDAVVQQEGRRLELQEAKAEAWAAFLPTLRAAAAAGLRHAPRARVVAL